MGKMETIKAQITVIGAGPGGYVAAIRAARLGFETLLVELKEENIGGVCLNRGCIPTKSLLHTIKAADAVKKQKDRGIKIEGSVGIDLAAAVARSKSISASLRKGIGLLLRKNKVKTIFGRGRIAAPGRVEVEGQCSIESEHVILATGGKPRELPDLPFDGQSILTTTDALNLTEPPREAVVIGGGASGLELGLIWAECGSRVTIIEILESVLPFIDDEAAKIVARACRKRGIKILTAAKVVSCEKHGSRMSLRWQGKKGQGELEADKVLVTAGTDAYFDRLWNPDLDIEVEKGFVKTDDKMRTSLDSVYAIGDLRGPPLLAHAASREGIMAVENIAGTATDPYDPSTVPSVVYFHPQVAQVGTTEKDALEKGMDISVGRFHFGAASMAVIQDESDGFVKIVSDKQTGKIVGATIVGPSAGELIGELSMAVTSGLGTKDFLKTLHPHPSLSEALHESALDIFNLAIHKV